MKTKNLYSSIIQLAISGKLVPQFDEEPSVIQIDDAPKDPPFEIPEKWKWVYLCNNITFNPKVSCPSDGFISFLGMKDICSGFINKHLSGEKKNWNTVKKGYTKFCNNDVLLAKITPCFQNRKSAIAKNLISGVGAGSSEFHVLRCDNNIVEPEFLLYFFKSNFLINYGVSHFTGTAGQQRVSTQVLKDCLFPLPPLAEQRRIVARLKEILPLIDKYDEYYTKLVTEEKTFPERLKKSILQQAIQGKLVPQFDEESSVDQIGDIPAETPFEIPEKWRWIRLGNIVSKKIKRGKTPRYVDKSNTLVFAQKCNTKQNGIDMSLALFLDEEKLNKYPVEEFLQDKDIVINSTGRGTMGRVGFFLDPEDKFKNKIVPDSHVTVIRVNKIFNADYVYFYLKSRQPFLESQGDGSTNQTELKPDRTVISIFYE